MRNSSFFIYIFTSYRCYSERSEESVFVHFFSTELHFNCLSFKESEANEGVKVGRCSLLKTAVFLLFFIYIIHHFEKIFTFGEIIFLLERCIVKKKTYLCECPAREMVGHIRKRFLLYPDFEIGKFHNGRIETIATLILYICI